MTVDKKNRWLSIATLILIVVNIFTLTLLWIGKRDNDIYSNRPLDAQGDAFEYITKELQLSKEQQAKFNELRHQHQAEQRSIRDSIRKAKDDFFGLLKQANVTDSILNTYSKRAVFFDEQMDVITFRHFQKVRALCDSTQQRKFDEIIKEILNRMGGPRRNRPPGIRDFQQSPPDKNDINPPPDNEEGSNRPPQQQGKGEKRPPPPGE